MSNLRRPLDCHFLFCFFSFSFSFIFSFIFSFSFSFSLDEASRPAYNVQSAYVLLIPTLGINARLGAFGGKYGSAGHHWLALVTARCSFNIKVSVTVKKTKFQVLTIASAFFNGLLIPNCTIWQHQVPISKKKIWGESPRRATPSQLVIGGSLRYHGDPALA